MSAKYYRDSQGRLLFIGRVKDGWTVFSKKENKKPKVEYGKNWSYRAQGDAQRFLNMIAEKYNYKPVEKLTL